MRCPIDSVASPRSVLLLIAASVALVAFPAVAAEPVPTAEAATTSVQDRDGILLVLSPRVLVLSGGLYASHGTYTFARGLAGAGMGIDASMGFGITGRRGVAFDIGFAYGGTRLTAELPDVSVIGFVQGSAGLSFHEWVGSNAHMAVGLGAQTVRFAGDRTLFERGTNFIRLGPYFGPRATASVDWNLWAVIDVGLALSTAVLLNQDTFVFPVEVSGRASVTIF